MGTARTKKKGIWSWIDNIQGDKVIWMIAILLILFSCITVFSSTSTLVKGNVSRLDIFAEQMQVVCIGLVVIFICYFIPKIWIFRFFSQFGFLVSFVLLMLLVLGIGVDTRNGATRALSVGGLQLNVYEVVKVAMVMYLAWASNASATKSFTLADKLSKFKNFKWLKKPFAQRAIYIYAPILIVMGLELTGGFSSTAIIAVVMVMTVLLGGVPFKEFFMIGLAALAALILGYGVYK
ncbi:MAG: FtsW/RodA/SpoVE family cell cycle protein, partial [Candidatus Cryptobacteroides sp.]